ncbi:Autoinducer 2 sensor kinase/phosphatase LuxQ [Pseudobythopirellula maris]|uniref:histidine kinase n=1 Tax=Pseudobythopirellula maris TaxID=2527991 RepID=A0A5C5ZT05_9BACT|nr:hybrid sensor histidine kinase/response regulator [Pseudobythopirellula maris]TWT90674.1 Autoinducer 2 sensor kinase/phosphatase LuxQ [Pseudobythopirellula maris]
MRKVLIIDDSPEDREMVAHALRQDPLVRYTIDCAKTGAAGLAMLQSEGADFDLLILDFRLPDMNAEQIVAQLIGPKLAPPLPIVVLTGSVHGHLLQSEPLAHGVQDYFTKSEITPPVLARVAQNAIERHRLVRRLVESEKIAEEARLEAERANRAKSNFLTLISHELRTPLTAILGFTTLLRKDPLASDAVEMLEMISGSGEHLKDLLNDLIDMAKVESGSLDVDVTPCNARDLLETTCQLMAIKAGDKGLPLTFEPPLGVPAELCTDPFRLRQIVLNLLGNAIKFTTLGEIRCRAAWESEDGRLKVWVSDSGPGIPDKIRDTIFTPFVQGAHVSGEQREGIGLGLAISHRLAAMMGGSLTIESTGPEGTTFLLEIDAPQPEESRSDCEAPIEEEAEVMPQLAGKQILVAEDTKAIRFLVKRLLAPTGASIDFVENGEEAHKQALSHGGYDAIIMDMLMPVMDGFTATRTLREVGVTIPIFALTAAAHSDELARCTAAGCTEVLTKPIDPDDLYRALSQVR